MTSRNAYRLGGFAAFALSVGVISVGIARGDGGEIRHEAKTSTEQGKAPAATTPASPRGEAEIEFQSEGPTFDTGGSRVSFRAAVAGRGAAEEPAAKVIRRVDRGVTSYRAGEVTTSYRKTALGTEQHVTISKRPSGQGKSVTVRVPLSGTLKGRQRGNRALFTAGGNGGIRVSSPTATDAAGKAFKAELSVDDRGIAYRVSDTGAQYPVTVKPLIQDGETLIPDDPDLDQGAPWSSAMSVDGRTAIVGSPGTAGLIGAAWIFKKIDGIWVESVRLKPSDETGQGRFGASVAISADGSTVAVGAPDNQGLYRPHHGNAGAAWVFHLDGASWVQQGSAMAPSDGAGAGVGASVALSADGDTALLGGQGTWVFRRQGTTWAQGPRLQRADTPADASYLTDQVALSGDGKTAVVGEPDNANGVGGAWVYSSADGGWKQLAAFAAPGAVPNGRFGDQVAVSSNGARALIGGGGSAWSATGGAGAWALGKVPLRPSDANPSGAFATKLDLSADGTIALIAGGQGSNRGAWIFRSDAGSWRQTGSRIPGISNNAGIDGVSIGEGSNELLVDGRTVGLQTTGTTIGG